MARTRVAVLMGGRSSEHEISLASARSVIEALDSARYEAVTVEIGRDGRWELGFGPFQHSMPEYFAFHPCFPEVRRLMIAADHPSREALLRDPESVLRLRVRRPRC